MARNARQGRVVLGLLGLLAPGCLLDGSPGVSCQEPVPPPATVEISHAAPPVPFTAPPPAPCDRPLPINLPTALQLAGARPIDIDLASERIRVADAQLQRARVLWLPTVLMGMDYFRHDGQIQDVAGNVFGTSKSAFMLGAGPFAVFALSDALFEPLAARQFAQARRAELQTARNDSLLAVAEAYFNVQQARGELAGAIDAARRAADLLRRVEGLAAGLVPQVEAVRARAELARRRQAVTAARERWRLASAELTRVLRLDAAAVVEPLEQPNLLVTLVPPGRSLDDLIAVGLSNRPELAAQQALVQATLERLRTERLRPLIPSVLLRGASTNPAGTLAGGYFGGGLNSTLKNFGARSDFDVQVLWELRNLSFGNRALVDERRADNRLAVLDLFRIQDRVAAEVAQAQAQVVSAAERLADAEGGLRDAADSVQKNFEGLRQTRRAGELNILVIRPQEAVQAVQALAQAYGDYYGAAADYNRAQFRLYRALGQPAQAISESAGCPAPLPAAPPTAPCPSSPSPGPATGPPAPGGILPPSGQGGTPPPATP